MNDLSLHIMDIVENSIRAEATNVSVIIEASTADNVLGIEIRDNGKGMDEAQLRLCEDPFYTTKSCKKTGLGISLFKQSALAANGAFSITSGEAKGTVMRATFQYNHIDRKPLGDLAKTLYLLIAAFPAVDFQFTCRKDARSFRIDTREIRKELEDIPISSPDVLKTLRQHIAEGIASVG